MYIKRCYSVIVIGLMLMASASAQKVNLQSVKAEQAPRSEAVVPTSGMTCMGAYLFADLSVGGKSKEELKSQYAIIEESGRLYVSAFVALDDESDLKRLASYGVRVNGSETRMASVMIPLDTYVPLVQSGLCRQIDVAKKVDLHNDRATRALRSDAANRGHFLTGNYDGTDVVVGIIDIGFEYGHPTFYDTTGTRYRVKCVWDQNVQCTTHPAGYSYGKEYLTQSSILNAVCSHTTETHGSHVAGIAAGSGGPGGARMYRGVAPNADLVLVATNMMSTGIYDGINYIKNYASSIGKPCVINMSLGSQVGPHDGTTLFDQMCDTYVGNTPGVLLCASAGNDGSTTLHLMKEFDAAAGDTSVASFLTFSGGARGKTYLDFWGMPGDTFGVQLGVVNINTGAFEDVSYLYSSAFSTTYNTTLTDADGESCSLDIYCTSADANNGRPNITINVNNMSQTSNNQFLCVRIIAHDGIVHAWANDANFDSRGLGGMATGDHHYTTGEIGIGRTMITVGSYMTRANWTCLSGTTYGVGGMEGDLSYFSSVGPSLDGRVKPDIVGPGQMIYSAVNKYDQEYCNPNGYWVVGSTQFNGATYYYATMQGTSMSCPAVAGCMALWLQANPQMTSAQAHQLLHNSGLQDGYTGPISTSGSTYWGWGKMNLYAGLPMTDDTTVVTNCRIDMFPYTDGFESKNNCWAASDDESDGTSWRYNDEWQDGEVSNHAGSVALVSRASTTGTDHVLMSPVIQVPESGENWSFTWNAGMLAADALSDEQYSVFVVRHSQSKLLYKGELNHNLTSVRQGVCLDAYRGDEIRIKIIHFAKEGSVGMTIDDVAIRQELVAPQVRIKYNGTTEGNIHVQPGEVMSFEAVVLNQVPVDEYSWSTLGDSWYSDSAKLVSVVFDGDMETWVNVFVSNQTGSDSFMRRIYVGNVGIDMVEEGRMTLYPNPSKGLVKVGMGDEEILGIEVVDELGRVVDVVSGTYIDLSKVRPGIYLVRVTTGSGVAVSRVVRI